jgi:hypothetical protein
VLLILLIKCVVGFSGGRGSMLLILFVDCVVVFLASMLLILLVVCVGFPKTTQITN